MEEQRSTVNQLLLNAINKFLNFTALIVLITVFSLDLGYLAYVVFIFLILYHATLLLFVYREAQQKVRKTWHLSLILLLTLLPYLIMIFV